MGALRLVRDEDGDSTDLTLLQQYEIHLRGAGRSERWIRESLWTLRRVEAHANKPVDACTPLDVSRFLSALNLKPSSRAIYFRQINGFYKWWSGAHGGAFITAVLPRPKEPTHEPRPISNEELRALLSLRMHSRTRVMVLLAAFAGLRVHEIAKFRGEDINLHRGTLFVTGKGGVSADLPLHPLMRHANLATTARYLAVTDERRFAAIERLTLGDDRD